MKQKSMFDTYGFTVAQRKRPKRQPEASPSIKLVRGVRADGEPVFSLWEWAKADCSKRLGLVSAGDAVQALINKLSQPASEDEVQAEWEAEQELLARESGLLADENEPF